MTSHLLAAGLSFCSVAASATLEAAPRTTPDIILVSILHADCQGAGADTLTVKMNGFVIAAVPTWNGCGCVDVIPTINVTDPALLAHYDPTQCNRFEVTSSPNPIDFGFVQVIVSGPTEYRQFCLFDGSNANPNPMCYGRSLCAAPGSTNTVVVGGADTDGDGVIGGAGPACDNCHTVPNVEQEDTDLDSYGDACDGCAGTGLFDWDEDTVCDGDDNCPYMPNPGQEDANGNAWGDACDCVMTPELCDDHNGCTNDYCEPFYGCIYDPINGIGDNNECTLDYCDPEVGAVFVPLTGTPCSDQVDCTSDICDEGVCVGTPLPSPEVTNVRAPNKSDVAWDFVVGGVASTTYQVARGQIGQFPAGSGAAETCVAPSVSGSFTTDPTIPAPGTGFWFLVRSRNFCAVGNYGDSSDGTQRAVSVCP